MVSITSIETKLVQTNKQNQITIAQIVLLDLESELDLDHPVTKWKMRTWVLFELAWYTGLLCSSENKITVEVPISANLIKVKLIILLTNK